MGLDRYRNEIVLGSGILLEVTRGLEQARADDGRVDAGEALSIFLSALLSGLQGVSGAAGDRSGKRFPEEGHAR